MFTISEYVKQELSNMSNLEVTTVYKKKEVKIILEFSETSSEKEVREFENCLKELYLKGIKVLSMKQRESGLDFRFNERKETGEDER